MQSTKHLIGITIILTAIVAVIGSTTPQKAFADNSSGWLPENFSPKHGTLLIERVTWPKKQGEKIEEFMAKNYPYKYEFVDGGKWKTDPKYDDKNSYPFVLVQTSETRVRTDMKSNRSQQITMYDFYFVERANNKSYPKSGVGSSWSSSAFEAIMKKTLQKKS